MNRINIDEIADIVNAAREREHNSHPFEMTPRMFQAELEAKKSKGLTPVCTFDEVIEAIRKERHFQDTKWGVNQPQSLAGMMLVAQAELNEAINGWIKNSPGKSAPLNELVQVAAVVVATLEKYGTTGITKSVDDIPCPQ